MANWAFRVDSIHDDNIRQYIARTGDQDVSDLFTLVKLIEGIAETLDPDNDHRPPCISHDQGSINTECFLTAG